MNRRPIHIILFILLSCFAASGQEEEGQTMSIHARAGYLPQEHTILLRWAPESAVAWKLLNEYGYRIEKHLLMKDGKLLDPPRPVPLQSGVLKAAPLENWEAPAEKNDNAAIAAQAIYGSSFEITGDFSQDGMQKIANAAMELENRYSFALFAADISPEVARLSGLYYEDRRAIPGEKYLYKIIPNVPADIMAIDTGYVYTGLEDYIPLPPVKRIQADNEGRQVFLSWDNLAYSHFYTAYEVERRAEDLKNFQRVHEKPFVYTSKKDESEDPRQNFLFLDSLPEAGKRFIYRLRGISLFGEKGPWSDTLSVQGYNPLPAAPAITGSRVLADQSLHLEWEFPVELNDQIKGFRIERSQSDRGPFGERHPQLLSPESREYHGRDLPRKSYYRVTAVAEEQTLSSFPWQVLLVDSIPPAAPEGLSGSMDSSGVVRLQWHANSEKDLLGYKVFRSNFRQHEFGSITGKVIADSSYRDTLTLGTLTRKVYYKVQAYDRHYNPGKFSEVLVLERPDTIPPSPGKITRFRVDSTGIHLSLLGGFGEDISLNLLYRRTPKEEAWKLVHKFGQQDIPQEFTDTRVKAGKKYAYTLMAVDRAGNESKPAKPIIVKALPQKVLPDIENFRYRVNREENHILLEWDYPYTGTQRFLIYRSKNDEAMTLYTSLDGNIHRYTDKKLNINNRYSYSIKALNREGKSSAFSQPLNIKF